MAKINSFSLKLLLSEEFAIETERNQETPLGCFLPDMQAQQQEQHRQPVQEREG